jgi:S-adenosylmethionine hydrolase
MSLLTLTTDYGYRDAEVALLKALIFKHWNDAKIVDVTHGITPYAVVEAAYVMEGLAPAFPKGTVHLMGLEPQQTSWRIQVAVLWKDQFWVGTDNGVFGLMMHQQLPEKIVKISIETANDLERLVASAVHLAKGESIDHLGESLEILKPVSPLKAVHDSKQKYIQMRVLLTDHYGNVITNLRKTQFEEWVGNKKFEIKLGRISIKKLIDAYEDVVPENNTFEMHFYEGKEFARFNNRGYLEIGLYRSINDKTGNARSLLGIDLMTEIRMYYE